MAEASRISLQTTLVPSFISLNHRRFIRPLFPCTNATTTSSSKKLSLRIRCSISTSSSATASTTATASGTSTIPWGCEVDSLENAEALQKWLSASGLPPQKMKIERVEVGERGLVALKNIRKGEKILFVPPALVITADSDWSCPEAGEVLKRNSVPDWPLLATYLISEASFISKSPWSNYISALPRQPYSLLYWTRSELDRYLEASQIRERAIERSNDVVGTFLT